MNDAIILKVILGVILVVAPGCASNPDPTEAEQAIAQLKPGMLQSQVEELLGAPAKITTQEATGLPVATYYLDLSTNYPGVLAAGKCLMTVHYDGQWAGLTFMKIEGPHYPDE